MNQPVDGITGGPADHFRPLGNGPAFSIGNKIERVLWCLTWLVFARYTPPQLGAWRRLLLRSFGAKVGAGVKVYGSARIWLPRNLELGVGVIIGPGTEIYNQGRIVVGPYSVISQHASLCASTHRASDPLFTLELRPITIGRACWVAAEAFVGPGVTMGDGVVLSARGALFDNAKEMGIYFGNPATLIRIRSFS